MKPNDILSTLVNRDAYKSTIWSVIQQLVVAASTYFIIKAIQYMTGGEMRLGIIFICAFVASLILVYLPVTLSMSYLQKWRLSSVQSFVEIFVAMNKGKASFGHTRNKVRLESWLTNECFNVYDSATNLLYQLISTGMNALFSIVIIAVAIDKRILAWYIFAGVVLVGANIFFRNHIVSASSEMQSSRNKLSKSMLSAWQNIFIGNEYNFQNWNSNFLESIEDSRESATRYDIIRSLISSSTVTLALAIVALGNGIYLYESIENLSAVAALIITLPRQLQIIQSIFAFFNLTLSWSGVKAQLISMGSMMSESAMTADSEKYVQFDKIAIWDRDRNLSNNNLDGVTKHIQKCTQGRWTLRGHNGAGKSTMLALLKEHGGAKAFLLPTNYEDLMFKNDFVGHSDGNRLLTVFQQLANLSDVHYVLLDEWDANLDQSNLEFINTAIEELAKTKLVIESRHRA